MPIDSQSVVDIERHKEVDNVEPPPLYRVLLLNDDYTPMEFVVELLRRFFALTQEQAIDIMLKIHHEGKGVCGVYPRDIAITKVERVSRFAQEHHHPLACIMEEDI